MKPLRVAVSAPDKVWQEISAIKHAEWVRADGWEALQQVADADACFFLEEGAGNLPAFRASIPWFIHAVSETAKEIHVSGNACRINAWPGCIQRNLWEVSGHVSAEHREIISRLQKEIVVTADEPGFVSGRVLAMIINEAYFALEEKVSTKQEMDIALRLGTNYPYGPFEWAEKIGPASVCSLLQKLSLSDPRYLPSSLLIQEAGGR